MWTSWNIREICLHNVNSSSNAAPHVCFTWTQAFYERSKKRGLPIILASLRNPTRHQQTSVVHQTSWCLVYRMSRVLINVRGETWILFSKLWLPLSFWALNLDWKQKRLIIMLKAQLSVPRFQIRTTSDIMTFFAFFAFFLPFQDKLSFVVISHLIILSHAWVSSLFGIPWVEAANQVWIFWTV